MKVVLRKPLLISLALLSSYSIAAKNVDINAFFASSKSVLQATTASLISPLKPSFLTASQKELVKQGALLPKGHEKMDSPTARFLEQCPEQVLKRLDQWTKFKEWIGSSEEDFTKFKTFDDLISDTQLQALVRATHEIIKLENKISKQGRFSLLHGEKKAFHINQKCFDVLMKRDHLEFVSTRFNTNFSQEAIKNGEIERKRKLQEGYGRDDLFTGYSLFAHGYQYESPAGFYIHGECFTTQPSDINPKYIFNLFGLGDIYKKYAQQIDDLDQEYQKICPNQQLLLLSLSPDAVEKTVYTALAYGTKCPLPTRIQSTTELLSTLRKNPTSVLYDDGKTPTVAPYYDEILFCHITTPDYGLHPDRVGKDIKVYTITGADPDEMSTYLKKETALFDEIKQEIKNKQAHA